MNGREYLKTCFVSIPAIVCPEIELESFVINRSSSSMHNGTQRFIRSPLLEFNGFFNKIPFRRSFSYFDCTNYKLEFDNFGGKQRYHDRVLEQIRG